MTFQQIRIVRPLLGTALVGFIFFLGYQFYRSREGKKKAGPPPVEVTATDSMTREVVHRTLDSEGRVVFELRAAERSGGLGEIQTLKNVQIRFDAGKEKKPLTVTGDSCRLNVTTKEAHLEGNVVVSDDKSLRIETDRLDYRPESGEVATDSRLKIFRHGIEGTAGGLRYATATATISLLNDVWFLLTSKAGARAEIVSQSAEIRRRESLIRFTDDVRVQGENRTLTCHDLQLYMNADESGLDHVEAFENVQVVMDVPATPAGAPATNRLKEPGRKRLTATRLEIEFRPDGSMERVRALDGGELVMDPPPAAATEPTELPMKRTVKGNLLVFEMDPDGSLTDFRGRGGVTLTLEPVSGPASEIRRVDSRQFESTFDPKTKDLVEARCYQSVEFSKGELRAEAETGIYRARHNRLNLTGNPRLWDSRSTLEASQVDIDVVTGDVEAHENVRTTQKPGAGAAALGFLPGGSSESIYVVARSLVYDRMKDVATYEGAVRALRGENQIQADRMVLRQTDGELDASESVRTSLLQAKKDAPNERIQASAGRFLYSGKDGVLRYREGVELVTPGMTVKGQRVYLTPDRESGALQEIQATTKVEVDLKGSRVRGEDVRYVAATGHMRVQGSKATMQDGDKLTEGKELIFLLADDKILVDGRAESRTRTVYTSKPPQ